MGECRVEYFFHLKERGTTVRTELMAGLTTFFAMAYILMVNANMFANPLGDGTQLLGVSYGAIYVATALSAVVGTVLVGLLANLPLAQATGMGLNAFFVYTVCTGFGFTYANGLVFVFFDGAAFILLTVTGLRRKIFAAIPPEVRKVIPAGIGLFIAFLGLQNAGLVVVSTSTCVTLGSFNLLRPGSWAAVMPLAVTVIVFLAVAIMARRQVKGAVLIGILGGSLLYYLLGLTVPGFFDSLDLSLVSPLAALRDFGTQTLGTVFRDGFDFSAYISAHGAANFALMLFTTVLAFCMVDLFDTMATLYGACARGGLLTADGQVPRMDRAMLADAVATVFGAVCGTSTVTTTLESSSGIISGGRTGLSSLFTAAMFFVSMFLSPVAQLIPSCATAAVLIYVGVLMMPCVREIEWNRIEDAVPAFLTMAMMPLTYNISYGLAFGMISYVAVRLFTGRAREIHSGTWAITALFLAMLLLTH